jgi:glycosyltransferase involved in cell wall biosynthesis
MTAAPPDGPEEAPAAEPSLAIEGHDAAPAGPGGRRRRVVILVENLPVPLDRRTWQEARTLADAGWDVTVIGPRGQDRMRSLHEHLDGIEVFRYPQRPASGLAGYVAEYLPSMLFTLFLLLRTARRAPIDVLHACNPPDLFWLFKALPGVRGARFVFDQHDANPELSLTKFGSGGLKGRFLYRLTLALERRSYRAAASVLVPNDTYGEIARQRGGVAAEQVHVIRNAPDIARYRAYAGATEPSGIRVGYVGVMGSQDGIDVLMEAWKQVVETPGLEGAVLEMIGDGEARSSLERLVRRLDITHSVNFHGYLQPERFVPILATCRLTVSPDPPTPFNRVSTMVKVIDSLAIGRPVVTFDLAESRRLIGAAGRIVEPPTAAALAAAIVELLRDPAETTRLGALATIEVDAQDMTWSTSAAKLIAAYDGLVPASNG